MDELAAWLGSDVRIDTVPLARDTTDWMLGSFWAHPERVLDAPARAATFGFARMDDAVVNRVVSAVALELEVGTWDAATGTCATSQRSMWGCAWWWVVRDVRRSGW